MTEADTCRESGADHAWCVSPGDDRCWSVQHERIGEEDPGQRAGQEVPGAALSSKRGVDHDGCVRGAQRQLIGLPRVVGVVLHGVRSMASLYLFASANPWWPTR